MLIKFREHFLVIALFIAHLRIYCVVNRCNQALDWDNVHFQYILISTLYFIWICVKIQLGILFQFQKQIWLTCTITWWMFRVPKLLNFHKVERSCLVYEIYILKMNWRPFLFTFKNWRLIYKWLTFKIKVRKMFGQGGNLAETKLSQFFIRKFKVN